MPRYIAFLTMPQLSKEQFTNAVNAVSKWRPDPRTTILKVYRAKSGKMVAECEAPTQQEFEAWLTKNGWNWESIEQVELIAQMGNVWQM